MSKYPSAEYHSDGSFKPKYRKRLESYGWSENKINNLEQIHKRHAAVEKEQAYWKEQHQKNIEEWRRKREAEKQEKERLGIKPTFEILYVSPDKINVNDMNPSQRRAYEMSGLSNEELLSQGYIEPDQLREFSSGSEEDKDPPPQKTDPNLPEIPF
ncbi:MAG: hypothetical protein QNJ32_28090 [Xenococcaceae cyanobacterium MO_167.B27]|nr:hypothetical protein [Xenococcaceae cyanobacterium MO_167.B27]